MDSPKFKYCILPVLWNMESQNTPQRTLKTVKYSLLCQQVQRESVPNKDPDVPKIILKVVYINKDKCFKQGPEQCIFLVSEFYNKTNLKK